MKKIGIVLLLGMFCLGARSQVFHTVDSLRNYQNVYIRNSAINAFTNLRLNTVLNGIANFLDSARLAWGGGGGGGAADGNNYSNSLALSGGVLTLGRTGLSALTANIVTTHVTEGTNLYYTNARARSSLSAGMGITYNSGAGTITADTATLFGFLPYLSWDNKNLFDSTAWFKSSSEVRLKSVQHSSGNSALTITKTLTDSTRAYSFVVNYSTALWNASQIQGRDVSASAPSTNDVLKWSGSQWQPGTAGTGDVAGQSSSVDNEIALFSGTGGKTIKRATGTGVVHSTSGVFSVSNIALASEVTGQLPNANLVTFKTYPAERTWSTIYEKRSWPNLSDFSTSGEVTISLNGDKVDWSATDIDYTNWIKFIPSWATGANKFKVTVDYKVTVAGGTWCGPGLKSLVTHDGANFGVMGFNAFNTGTNQFIYDETGSTQYATGTAPAKSIGDLIEVTFTRNDTTITYTVKNLTTSSSTTTLTYNYPTNQSVPVPNVGQFAWMVSGTAGTGQFQYIKIEILETQYPTLLVIGNSKVAVGYGDSWAQRIGEKLNNTYPTTVFSAGSAENLTDLWYKLPELLQRNPQQVLCLDCWSNSIRAGTPLQSVIDSMELLRSKFANGGTKFLVAPLPEDSTVNGASGLTAFKNYWSAAHASEYIDTWTPMSSSNKLLLAYAHSGADKVHLNQVGQDTALGRIIASGLISTVDINRRSPFTETDENLTLDGGRIGFRYPISAVANRVIKFDDKYRMVGSLLYDNGTAMIVSSSANPTVPLGNILFNVNNAISSYGNVAGMYLFDRSNASNFHNLYSNTNILRLNYSGSLEYWTCNEEGKMRLSLSSSGTYQSVLQLSRGFTYNFTPNRTGFSLDVAAATYNYSSNTALGGAAVNAFAASTFTGTGATSFTNFSTVFIGGAPIAGSNVTITNALAFEVNSGRSFFNDEVNIGSVTDQGAFVLQVTGKTYHSDEVNIGSTTDQGAYSLQNTGNIYNSGDYYGAKHYTSLQTLTSSTAGSGAGTGPTLTVTGGDVSGKIVLATGTSPASAGDLVVITFLNAYAAAPSVVITPGNSGAAALSGTSMPYVSSVSTTQIVFTAGSTALAGSTTYIWYYHVLH
jgi:hypothetical protein